MIKDRRCLYCNWLNKETERGFICLNCYEQDSEEEEEVSHALKTKAKIKFNN